MIDSVWIDGSIVSVSEARVSPFDHGVTVGAGVFETLVVVDGVPFAWRRHHERLLRSGAALGIEVPPSAELRAGADALLGATGLRSGRLRVTVTAGEGPLGSGRASGPPVATVIVSPITPADPHVDVVVAPWTRNERGACAGLKTISYASNVRALRYAAELGAGEALFENTQGFLCEATGSNVFVVSGGALRTPPEHAGCLLGVTRSLLLELAPAIGITAVEADVTVAELAGADEAFLASTTRRVQPIRAVDSVALASCGGPVSDALAAAFAELVARNLDP
jgi:branched-chain amino acid aminotransferase